VPALSWCDRVRSRTIVSPHFSQEKGEKRSDLCLVSMLYERFADESPARSHHKAVAAFNSPSIICRQQENGVELCVVLVPELEPCGQGLVEASFG